MKFISSSTDSALTLEQWQAARATATGPVALQIANDYDVELLADDLHRFSRIELQFPKWVDGRAYSQARLLRARLRFGGELRAVGEVLVDMLPLLARTGFTAVQLRAGESEAAAREALAFFPGHYQGDVGESRPWFLRAAVAAA
ncbi:MAG: DUF934 domain-containing protein [Pelomonas sp.]|nr:DUF934 domain-containing protein [Roseateles sp.]